MPEPGPIEVCRDFAIELIRKSGVREWDLPKEDRDKIMQAAIDFTMGLFGTTIEIPEGSMALPDYQKMRPGTTITVTISPASIANVAWGSATTTGARQSASIDLRDTAGNLPKWVDILTEFELAATPTAGNIIGLFGAWGRSTGASQGGTDGTDSAYTGSSSNADAVLGGLHLLGSHRCTAVATSGVQKMPAGGFRPKAEFLNLIIRNMSGSSFHSTNTNQKVYLIPHYPVIQDSESGA